MRRRHICAVLAATGSALPFNVHAQAAMGEKERAKPKLAIVATMEIAPGRMDEFLPLVLAHRARCLRDEPGTLGFECLRLRGNPNGLMLYELYVDDAAFDAHSNGASIKRIQQESAGMVLSISDVMCTPVDIS
jgi:quinol monooxygenase YgiN